jgi:hypothetical protein
MREGTHGLCGLVFPFILFLNFFLEIFDFFLGRRGHSLRGPFYTHDRLSLLMIVDRCLGDYLHN